MLQAAHQSPNLFACHVQGVQLRHVDSHQFCAGRTAKTTHEQIDELDAWGSKMPDLGMGDRGLGNSV